LLVSKVKLLLSMNTSLNSADGNKKRKIGSASSALTFGLNSRKEKGNSRSTSSKKNVFGDDDDSSGSDGNGGGTNKNSNNSQIKSRREVVNEQIAKEQAARRRRAQADLASVNDKSVYDYDGAYDSFQTNMDATKTEREKKKNEKKSKYIGDLLKAAKVRERERDVIFERRNAREQAEEDARDEYKGKEKFVTNSYKRKLQERKQWEAEQEEKDREEAANDVTKKSAGAAFAGFYGNLNRSAIMKQMPNKGDRDEERVIPDDEADKEENSTLAGFSDDDFDPRQGVFGGFQRSSASGAHGDDDDDKITVNGGHDHGNGTEQCQNETTDKTSPPPDRSLRQIRERKVAEARGRYLKRKQALVSDQ